MATLVISTVVLLASAFSPPLGSTDHESPGTTAAFPPQAVEFPIRVEPQVELFSIIHRLAGTGQYDEVMLPRYVQEVWDHFGDHRNHPAVVLVQEMNREHGINGNAPMDLAVHLTPVPELELRAPVDLVLDDLDSRWSADLIPPLLAAARDFARDTDFLAFFDAHMPFYEDATSSLRTTLTGTEMLPWFKEFFGGPPEDYVVILGLLNGSCNYGSRVTFPDGRREFVSMLGARDPTREGIPAYSRERFVPTIVHEFNHSYINPLVDRNREALEEPGEALFSHLREGLHRWGYDHWYVMLYEYLVRGATIRYLDVNEGPEAAGTAANRDVRNGFPGIPELASLLAEYQADRDTYSDLDSFMPRIVAFFQELAEEVG